MSDSFLASLANTQPIPGGGAAAAYTASVGLALLEKIVRLEMQRDEMPFELSLTGKTLLGKVAALKEAFVRLRNEDGEAYLRWAAIKTSEENGDVIEDALRAATACPISIVEGIQEALECVIEAGKHAKRHLLSDLLAVCEILNGAGKAAAHIACANLQLMTDASPKNECEGLLVHRQRLADQSCNRARETLHQRLHGSRRVCSDIDDRFH